jgi:hypothetical protein
VSGRGVDPALVRSALERALVVAREGEGTTPRVPAPKELARYLGFSRLTGPALGAVLRVLDGDDEFRTRVRDATDPAALDAAGWLALARPPGWEALLEAVGAARARERSSAGDERRVADLERRLDGSEGRRASVEADLRRMRDELAASAAELTAVRRDRRRAETARSRAEERVDQLAQELHERQVRLSEAQGAWEAREHELAETRRLLAEARAELDDRPVPSGERAVDVAALRDAAERLRRAAATLSRSVDAVSATVPPEPVVLEEPGGLPARRAPVPPGGVVTDSAAGGRWLLGLPGAVVLVDGYNVAKRAWPDADLEDQRLRLLRALDELALRAGARVEVIFDGPADPAPAARQSTRSVAVRYSGGALADDVVVDRVVDQSPETAVIVVSDDNEVREGARARGAAVLGTDTLRALFGA